MGVRSSVSKRALYKRDEGVCGICGEKVKKWAVTIDHVIPRSRGGADTYENTQIAHFYCNTHKGNRMPDEYLIPLPLGGPNHKPRYRNKPINCR